VLRQTSEISLQMENSGLPNVGLLSAAIELFTCEIEGVHSPAEWRRLAGSSWLF
jgi:hypothetical protein